MYSGTSWGGYTGEKIWLNVYHWFWAIADGGRPSDVDVNALAQALECSVERAAEVRAKADLYFAQLGRMNHRTFAFQRLARLKKDELRREATRAGVKVSGWDTKAEIVDLIVEKTLPQIRFENDWTI